MAASYDMVREILLRVKDVTTLFRCAAVCKEWRGLLVDDATFLRRCLPEAACRRSSSFLGFFYQRRPYPGCPPPRFVPAPHPVLAPHLVIGDSRRSLSSFIPSLPGRYFDCATPLASRHGLLLVRLEQHYGHPDPRGVLLAVCDPLAGTVHELPYLDHYWDFQEGRKISGYALLTAADYSSSNNDDNDDDMRSPFFKVLIITIQHKEMRYNLHIFSSADRSGWTTRSGALDFSGMLMQHNAVVLGGAAHWLIRGETGTYTIDASAETGHVSSTKMMGVTNHGFRRNDYDKPCLTVDGEGNLTVLRLERDGSELEISTSHDNGRSFKASRLMLRQPDKPDKGSSHVYTCLGEKCGMMYVKVDHRHVHIADIKTGVMREVLDWPCSNGLCRRKIVPLEIDWPAFFASRLAIGT